MQKIKNRSLLLVTLGSLFFLNSFVEAYANVWHAVCYRSIAAPSLPIGSPYVLSYDDENRMIISVNTKHILLLDFIAERLVNNTLDVDGRTSTGALFTMHFSRNLGPDGVDFLLMDGTSLYDHCDDR